MKRFTDWLEGVLKPHNLAPYVTLGCFVRVCWTAPVEGVVIAVGGVLCTQLGVRAYHAVQTAPDAPAAAPAPAAPPAAGQ